MRMIPLIALLLFISLIVWQCGGENTDDSGGESEREHAIKHLDPNYVCPMHPSVVSDKPGSCPICGMDLEPRKTSQQQDSDIVVSAAMQRSLGVTTATVEYGPVSEEVYGSGVIARVSAAQTSELTSKVSGTVRQILIKPGGWVRENGALLVVESADFTRVRDAYVEARTTRQHVERTQYLQELLAMGADRETLVRPALLGALPEHLEVASPQSGKLDTLHVNVGDSIEPGALLASLSAPKLTEVEFRSYSRSARAIEVGNKAFIELSHLPGRTWPGRVVDVRHNESSYFSVAEVHFELPDDLIFTGSFAGAYIQAGRQENVLRIPASAVIFGDRHTRVVRMLEGGRFRVLDVEIGFESPDWIEIISGLKAGGTVVTRGQFMIDSEASLRAGLARLQEGNATP
ncbi:MAG: efflux RND transporter periplasmic adaptor subunit [Gammaproteobacteria bacterium]